MTRHCIIDGAAGIYMPQAFAELYCRTAGRIVKGFDSTAPDESLIEDLLAGPDHPHYWYSWEEVLDNFHVWRLGEPLAEEIWLLTHDEGGLFIELIPEDDQ